MKKTAPALLLLTLLALLQACTTSTTIDEYREDNNLITINAGERVVVLGRRHAGEYETEPDFIDCIGDKLSENSRVTVLEEPLFLNSLYPWFEPRTAPLSLKRLRRVLKEPLINNKISELGIRYMIWVDGNTETTESSGSISCAIGPGGGGCFGFATWDKTSSYEAIIWDLTDFDEEGRVRVDTKGSSYLVGVGAPLPFIARVQSQACESIGNQLRGFFDKENTPPESGESL
ncbi:MAG: hypothetical protein R3E73_14655 [Porticoccaceae bacterium]|nr:hypothetical protein [Pseudomonadales bacterium]MCP5303210.1 hypothetical protein [Pseudomonadales bacterium]